MNSLQFMSCLWYIFCVLTATNADSLRRTMWGMEETILLCDEVYRQLDFVKSENELMTLRLEIMDLNVNKQQQQLTKIESNLRGIEAYLEKLDRKLDLISRKDNTQLIGNNMYASPTETAEQRLLNIEEKIRFLSEIRNIKERHVSTDNIDQKSEDDRVDVPTNGSLLIGRNGQGNVNTTKDIQSNQAKIVPMEGDLITNIFEKEEPKMCMQNQEKVLLCANITLPTSCFSSNSVNCFNHKCRIQNRLYGPSSFLVPCEDTAEGGGWTVIQRRTNDSIGFSRNWTEYKNGFGDLNGSYWIGLDKLYALTTTLAPVELLIQLQDYDDVKKHAKYNSFAIGDEGTQYVIKSIGTYSGTAGDSFSRHKGLKFSTIDRDNDTSDKLHCASKNKAGWWYFDCFNCNLNGLYLKKGEHRIEGGANGINWYYFHGYDYSMKFVQMSIRPRKM